MRAGFVMLAGFLVVLRVSLVTTASLESEEEITIRPDGWANIRLDATALCCTTASSS